MDNKLAGDNNEAATSKFSIISSLPWCYKHNKRQERQSTTRL